MHSIISLLKEVLLKRFIVNITIFIFISLASFIVLWILICLTREDALKLPNNVDIVFLGNSHIECDINDSIVSNSFNFARSNDYPEQIYCKIKLLKRINPKLDTIVMGYDNVIMEQDLTREFQGIFSPYYYDLYSIEDIYNIIKNSSFKFCVSHFYQPFNINKIGQAIPSIWDKSTNIAHMKNLGRYEYLVRDKLNKHIELQKDKKPKLSSFDHLSKYYLKKIINFCRDNKMTIILLAAPQHHKSKIDTITYKQYIQQNFSEIPFYDLRNMPFPDSCFGDLNHLNYKGARIFSEYLEKEVLHKDNYKK